MGFLAELTEQNHETSHGAGGDMCEGTPRARGRGLLEAGCSPGGKSGKKPRTENHLKKTTDRETLEKKHGKQSRVFVGNGFLGGHRRGGIAIRR